MLKNYQEYYELQFANLKSPAEISRHGEVLLNQLCQKISACTHQFEAEAMLDQLLELCWALSFLYFKKETALSQPLVDFIGNYERLDDPWLRNKAFRTIQSKGHL